MAEEPPFVKDANERAPNPLEYRTLSKNEKAGVMHLKDAGLGLIRIIEANVPAGREQSLAKTKVEEAVMWAVKGLTA